MIFYFSATGNSLWAAHELSRAFDEPMYSIPEELNTTAGELLYSVGENEKVFFVYPVHTWGPAIPVRQFIRRLRLKNYHTQNVYSVCTCGSDCGHTDRIIRKELLKRKIHLSACYSISMPNTYILAKGFNTDTPLIAQNKLKHAPKELHKIIQVIKGLPLSKPLYQYSSFPSAKSRILYPIFVHLLVGKNSFHATDQCISCGHCEQICPTQTIRLQNGKPEWANTCIQCCACIHRCPVQAIEYGKITLRKGRYHHPDIK